LCGILRDRFIDELLIKNGNSFIGTPFADPSVNARLMLGPANNMPILPLNLTIPYILSQVKSLRLKHEYQLPMATTPSTHVAPNPLRNTSLTTVIPHTQVQPLPSLQQYTPIGVGGLAAPHVDGDSGITLSQLPAEQQALNIATTILR
jgi:hypothetical protein